MGIVVRGANHRAGMPRSIGASAQSANASCTRDPGQSAGGQRNMLYWAVIFLVVAIIAGVFGFGGISQAATGIAKILFLIFLVLFLVSLVATYV
jgi:uncharacterized membrane protein YtjA (UPF0391 family)